MNKFSRKDLIYSVVTGLMTGFIAWRVFEFLQIDIFGKFRVGILFYLLGFSKDIYVSPVWLILIVPVVWIAGVIFGYFLGRWIGFFNQFGRYVAVGFTNFFVDAGILNLLIGSTGIESGWHYSLFKTISFIVAVTNSYVLNKYWVFEAASSGGGRSELFKFLAVNIVAIIINVGVASFVVNYVTPFNGMDAKTWANAGSVAGSAFAIMFTFVGSRLIVFKKQEL